MLQRSGLSTIGDILRQRRLSLFGHVARLDLRVPAHDVLHLTVDILRKQKGNGQMEKTTGSPLQRLAQQGSGGCVALHCSYLRCGDLRLPGATELATVHSDYATTTMMMKDKRIVSKMKGITNFSRHLQAVRNRDCWVFENRWRRV